MYRMNNIWLNLIAIIFVLGWHDANQFANDKNQYLWKAIYCSISYTRLYNYTLPPTPPPYIPCPSVRPLVRLSVDGLVSALNPFYIYTSHQATWEGVLIFFQNSKFRIHRNLFFKFVTSTLSCFDFEWKGSDMDREYGLSWGCGGILREQAF